LGAAFSGGFLLPTIITFLYTKVPKSEVIRNAWSCVQEIDNPLIPWPEVFTREKKPALSEVRRALASLRHLTWMLVTFNFIVYLGFWQIPGHAIQKLNFGWFLYYVGAFVMHEIS
uniref:Fatty acid desaturase n=1 Tax=Hydatigena taeniaeformis TaxID=6205 RepID=A0A0R3WWB1_HYDTA